MKAPLSENARRVLESRYLARDEAGRWRAELQSHAIFFVTPPGSAVR